jgi:hypothetical protein
LPAKANAASRIAIWPTLALAPPTPDCWLLVWVI